MLECQRIRIQERGRLRAQGFTDEQIRQAEAVRRFHFRPAFENGQRRPREAMEAVGEGAAPASFHQVR